MKKLLLLSLLLPNLVFGFVTTVPWQRINGSGVAPLYGSNEQVLVGETSTTTNSKLETTSLTVATTTSGCLNVNGSGVVYSATCSSGLASYDAFTHPYYGGSATTSLMTLTVGLLSTASTTLSSTIHFNALGIGGLAIDSNGLVYSSATTTFSSPLLYSAGNVTCQTATGSLAGCLTSTDWNTFNNKLSTTSTAGIGNDLILYTSHTGIIVGVASSSLSLPNSALQNSTISGVSLGNNLGTLNHDTSFTGSTYSGNPSISDWGLALNHTNTWSVLQNFNYASVTSALTVSSELNIPHSGTVPTLFSGDIYANTNSIGSSSIATSDGTNTHTQFFVHSLSRVFASSTLSYLGSFVNAANPYVVFGAGSASTTALQCTTGGGQATYASNNTWKGRQPVYFAIGTASGTTTIKVANPLHGSILQSAFCSTDATTPNMITITADVEDTN